MPTYEVDLPDGSVDRRSSKMATYTHALVVQESDVSRTKTLEEASLFVRIAIPRS
jgi:hypothetical protein